MKIHNFKYVQIFSECWTIAEKKTFQQKVSEKMHQLSYIHTLLSKAYTTEIAINNDEIDFPLYELSLKIYTDLNKELPTFF